MRLYTDGCVVNSGTGLMGPCKVRRTPSTPQAGEFRVKGNTPDFMLEHFIILYCDVTAGTPHRWGVTLMARTIQHNSTKDDIG